MSFRILPYVTRCQFASGILVLLKDILYLACKESGPIWARNCRQLCYHQWCTIPISESILESALFLLESQSEISKGPGIPDFPWWWEPCTIRIRHKAILYFLENKLMRLYSNPASSCAYFPTLMKCSPICAYFWWAPIIGYELIFQEIQYWDVDKMWYQHNPNNYCKCQLPFNFIIRGWYELSRGILDLLQKSEWN